MSASVRKESECSNCGAPLPPTTDQCPYCGAWYHPAESPSPPEPEAPPPPSGESPARVIPPEPTTETDPNAFDTDVNSLPLSMILSWYEQKACCILLSLLHLGIQNIKLGPSLPAFVTPAVLNVLVEKFNIAPVTTAEEDLKAILA